MTTEQKNRVTALRKAGIGYTKIAREVGISENTVKSYCRRNGLASSPAQPSENEPREKSCQMCGKPFMQYNALASRFEDTKAKYEKVTADIAAKGIRRRELERFILAVEKLPAMVTEFDEALWGSLVDHLTVNGKDDIVFTMSSGMEIKV